MMRDKPRCAPLKRRGQIAVTERVLSVPRYLSIWRFYTVASPAPLLAQILFQSAVSMQVGAARIDGKEQVQANFAAITRVIICELE